MVDFSPSPDFSPPGGTAFSVTTKNPADLRLDQFVHELAKAHGWKDDELGTFNYMAGGGIEGWVLQISRGDVDLVKLKKVGRAHKPNPNFVPPERKT